MFCYLCLLLAGTFCQGQSGNSDGITGSAGFTCSLMKLGHCLTTSSSWWLRPGHHTDALALSRHFVISWCASCNFSRTSILMVKGTTSRFPFITIGLVARWGHFSQASTLKVDQKAGTSLANLQNNKWSVALWSHPVVAGTWSLQSIFSCR